MKKFIVFVVLILSVGACSVSPDLSLNGDLSAQNSSVYDNAKVKLYYAHSDYIVIGGAVVERWIRGYVCLENLAYNKEVIIHYSVNGAAWQKKAISGFGYQQAAPETGKEVWCFNIDLPAVNYQSAWKNLLVEPWAAVNVEFAIEYKVNGQTYWDNNGGRNYKMSTRGTNPQSGLVAMGRSLVAREGYTSPINGNIYYDKLNIAVANTAYTKKVTVLYTKNNWNTSAVLTADYNGSSPDGSIDYFLVDLPYENGDSLKYAISYTAQGVTTWDNNFGNDYLIGSGQ